MDNPVTMPAMMYYDGVVLGDGGDHDEFDI